MELAVYNTQGTDTGRRVEGADNVFQVESPSDHAIYLDIRLILANQRQGTHKSKERGEVSGSNKKPYRQKGTGNARSGHKRSPLWRHGGRVFGPRPRNYGFKLNKKVKSLARRSALTYKANEENLTVVENFSFDAPKTKQFKALLNSFSLSDKKVLLVLSELDYNVYLSGRNLSNAHVCQVSDLNTYDILNADALLVTEDALGTINEKLG